MFSHQPGLIEMRYVIVLDKHTWDVSAADYAVAAAGSCVGVTYGPRSGYVMGVHRCVAPHGPRAGGAHVRSKARPARSTTDGPTGAASSTV